MRGPLFEGNPWGDYARKCGNEATNGYWTSGHESPKSSNRSRHLLLITAGSFWKLLTKQYTWTDHPDMAYQVLPWYQFEAASWHHGMFPLWDPHVWSRRGCAAWLAVQADLGARGGHVTTSAALFELGTVTGQSFRHRETPGGYLQVVERHADVIAFLKKQSDFVRLEVDTDALPYNIGDWDGFDQFRGYLGGMTSNLVPFEIERLKGGPVASNLFGLNYAVGTRPFRSGQTEVFHGASGLNVYRIRMRFPSFGPSIVPAPWRAAI